MIQPVSVFGQRFRRPFSGSCETCEVAQVPSQCTISRPVVQTQLQPRQVTTYRNVTETHYRNETVVEQVPSTTVRNVTVDAGEYRMVWVPRPVTKQVAETVVKQQVKTRAVPYQVTRKVPQTITQLVPVQTVHHVEVPVGHHPISATTSYPIAHPSIASSGCRTCSHSNVSIPLPMTDRSGQITSITARPAFSSTIQTLPAILIPIPEGIGNSKGNGSLRSTEEEWQTISPRSSSSRTSTPGSSTKRRNPNGTTNNLHDSAASNREVPIPLDDAARPTHKSSRFVPAPSAAMVWNSRRNDSK